ncbi:MAG: heavy-metal-associated domain-containing protein, partial [Acidobacteriota bacterium]|nr:heavy-metal-associated domain-containing protein [Acidobacteriota bacterium]
MVFANRSFHLRHGLNACAYAVRVALKKFSGVESVDVSLNKGLATVKLKPGNSVEPQQFWDAVRKDGFT